MDGPKLGPIPEEGIRDYGAGTPRKTKGVTQKVRRNVIKKEPFFPRRKVEGPPFGLDRLHSLPPITITISLQNHVVRLLPLFRSGLLFRISSFFRSSDQNLRDRFKGKGAA